MLGRDTGEVRAVNDVSLDINPGETLGLVGESGSGKSTLGRLILRLVEPTSGTVSFDGHDVLDGFRKRITSAPPPDADHLPGPIRLTRSAHAGRRNHYRAAANPWDGRRCMASIRRNHRLDRARSVAAPAIARHAAQLMKAVGLEESALRRYPHEFSGGQRQRIGIARALALRPKFIVADEPVSALDVSVGAQIVNLLKDLQRDFGLTYLFISHSMPVVRYLATRIAVMYRGKIVEIGSTEQITTRPQQDYTKKLLEATPELEAAR